MNRKRMIIINSSIFALVVLALFFVRPAYLGYVAYRGIQETDYDLETFAENIEELKDDILVSNTNLSTCYDFNQVLLNQLDQSTDNLILCNNELSNFIGDEKNYKLQIQGFRENIGEKDRELIDLQDDYDMIILNLANKICCKEKIDNNRVNSYEVRNDDIVCLEDGENSISCSFE